MDSSKPATSIANPSSYQWIPTCMDWWIFCNCKQWHQKLSALPLTIVCKQSPQMLKVIGCQHMSQMHLALNWLAQENGKTQRQQNSWHRRHLPKRCVSLLLIVASWSSHECSHVWDVAGHMFSKSAQHVSAQRGTERGFELERCVSHNACIRNSIALHMQIHWRQNRRGEANKQLITCLFVSANLEEEQVPWTLL